MVTESFEIVILRLYMYTLGMVILKMVHCWNVCKDDCTLWMALSRMIAVALGMIVLRMIDVQ
jgi:hypothetical protein